MASSSSSSSFTSSARSSSSSPVLAPCEDPNSHFFLHPSDNSNTVVVTPELMGSNYLSWSRAFTLAISVKNKLGFLDGSVPMPEPTESLYPPWLRCNNLLLSWLLKSISKDLASTVLYINSAKHVWDKLKARFAQPDEARIFHLQYQLNLLVQGSLSISDYFTQLNAIWEELRNYRPLPYCSCGHCTCNALQNVSSVQQKDYVFKFLMGLHDSYSAIRGQIVLMNPIASLDHVFSMVLQEERQRETSSLIMPISEPSALAVYQHSFKKKGKSDVVCAHCGKTGHCKDKCYRLIGFPPGFKFTK